MESAEAKELAAVMKAGFEALEKQVKDLDGKFNAVQLERATEKGFELKDKVQRNTEAIEKMAEWKATTDMSLATWRRVSWALVGAVGTLVIGIIIALINYLVK